MSDKALARARDMARRLTDNLGGRGIFGVEFFVNDDEVWFNEVSPRPHDTGLVTLVSQDLSEFALHTRAVLGLPVPAIRQFGPAASCALLVKGTSQAVSFSEIDEALARPDTTLRLFGKPEVNGRRRMGVGLARAETLAKARAHACEVIETIRISL